MAFSLPDSTPDLLALIPEQVWAPAYDAHDQVRDGAWVADLTGLLNMTTWRKGGCSCAGTAPTTPSPRPSPGCCAPTSSSSTTSDCPVGPDAAEGLYRLVDTAYEKRSVAISSNLLPAAFDELMPKTLATATVDRLLHHAHICQTSGDSVPLSRALTGQGVRQLT